jgi:hypothetical protein
LLPENAKLAVGKQWSEVVSTHHTPDRPLGASLFLRQGRDQTTLNDLVDFTCGDAHCAPDLDARYLTARRPHSECDGLHPEPLGRLFESQQFRVVEHYFKVALSFVVDNEETALYRDIIRNPIFRVRGVNNWPRDSTDEEATGD